MLAVLAHACHVRAGEADVSLVKLTCPCELKTLSQTNKQRNILKQQQQQNKCEQLVAARGVLGLV